MLTEPHGLAVSLCDKLFETPGTQIVNMNRTNAGEYILAIYNDIVNATGCCMHGVKRDL